MKRQYLYVEFAVVLLILGIPPVLVGKAESIPNFSLFNPIILIQIILSIVLILQQYLLTKDNTKDNDTNKFRKTINILLWGAVTLGILYLVFSLIQIVAFFLPEECSSNKNSNISCPNSLCGWLITILTLIAGSFYEESIYRMFIPQTAIILFKNKYLKLAFEVIAVLLFGFAHRYLGWLNVFDGILCGIALRLCYIKTGSIFTGIFVHFLYNLSVFLLFIF